MNEPHGIVIRDREGIGLRWSCRFRLDGLGV
jgi:hypothetical protein